MATTTLALLRRHLGFDGFRPGQEELIQAVLGGRDALGVLPTGGGKSVCYQIPALALGGLTLVVTPLVSLMEDQVRRAREAGIAAWCLAASQTEEDRRRAERAVSGGDEGLLFVSPERTGLPGFLHLVGRRPVRLVAIDEAHCISEWGHDFRPAYRRLGHMKRRFDCPVLALTASATPAVRRDIVESLGLEEPTTVVHSFDRPNLRWRVSRAGSFKERIAGVHARLVSEAGVSIVYAATRGAVEAARDALARRGHRVEAYHAGLPGAERSRVLEAFMEDRCRVVVATNAFGMGIDRADVRRVTHLQLPVTLESYYQEAGRAGRDGGFAECEAFHGRRDSALGRRFLERSQPGVRRLRRALRLLERRFGRRVEAPSRDVAAVLGDGTTPEDLPPLLLALERAGSIRGGVQEAGTPDVVPGSQLVACSLRGPPDRNAVERSRRESLRKLAYVRRYARASSCRRNVLLGYFGERSPAPCGQCDRCTEPARVLLITKFCTDR